MGIAFEWDSNKRKANFLKHNVSFEEATTVFGDDPLPALGEVCNFAVIFF